MVDTMDELDYMLPANCPNPYFDSWDRHNSIAFSATKGLRNAPGENNCFVNCAVQVLWHLDVFRRSYRRMLGHTCMGNSCIFCALKVIFTQFQYSDKAALHPDALRKALAETFANQQRFQLGHMDDAAECFENILRRIHFHVASGVSEDACTAAHCLPHQKFAMHVQEKVVCPCGASSNPLKFGEMVHYVSASALVAQSRTIQQCGDALHPDRFGLLLRKAASMGDVRDCPAGCGLQIQKQRTLLNIPDVVSVGLVWDSDRPSVEMTTEVASCLGTVIHLQDMFHCVMPDIRCLPRLQLVAVVCYYGKHYSTFVFHSKLRTWVYFDDATVREIGPRWENVVEKCSRGRFQPLLLLYANPNATPVPVDTAPHKRVMAPGYAPGPVIAPDEVDGRLNRTHESIKSIQLNMLPSVTSNMDHHMASATTSSNSSTCSSSEGSTSQDSGRDSPARLSREHARQPSFLIAVTGKNEKNRLLHGGSSSPVPAGMPGNYPGKETGMSGNYPGKELRGGMTRTILDNGVGGSGANYALNDDCASYTLSGGDQYRRPYINGLDSSQLPMPPNISRQQNSDAQYRDNFRRSVNGSKEKGMVDVIRYQVDSSRALNNYTPDITLQQSHTDFYNMQRGESYQGKAGGSHSKPPVVFQTQQQPPYLGQSDRTVNMGEHISNGQHVVLKPKPTAHGQNDTVDSNSHSAVQSGLATLPRHKGQNSVSADQPSHQRQCSSHQEVAQITRQASMGNLHFLGGEGSLPPGTPPPEYQKSDPHHIISSRQASVSSQGSMMKPSASMSHLEQSVSNLIVPEDKDKPKKKSKKDSKEKKDKKSADKESSKKSESKKSSLKLDAASKKKEIEVDLLEDGTSNYIDRQKVESVMKLLTLKQQGVHRTNSSCSNNSSSSVESDTLMGRLLASKAAENSFDSVSLGSHKDSGYGSSDRNSSSSTGSGTIDPYTQYFISKSMVVPRTVNTQIQDYVPDYSKTTVDHYSSQSSNVQHFKNLTGPTNEITRHGSNMLSGCKVMHPIRESSQEDILRAQLPQEHEGNLQKVTAAIPSGQTEGRPPPVPPKNFAQFHVIKSSQSAYQRETSFDGLDKDAGFSEQFVTLCKKADGLMDSCMLAETKDDFVTALALCNNALGCLKEAMSLKDLNSKALAFVQMRHNPCLVKSRSLQKIVASRQGSGQSAGSSDGRSVSNRSSITSSDSDATEHPGLLHKRHASLDNLDIRSASAQPGNSSRSPGSTQVVHSYQGSFCNQQQTADGYVRQGGLPSADMTLKNGGLVERNQHLLPTGSRRLPSQDFKENRSLEQQQPDTSGSSGIPVSHPGSCLVGYSTGGAEDGENSADLYGTLPRNKSRKPSSDVLTNPEAYQSFLHKQKCLQAGVSASQQSLDSVKSDSSSSDHGNAGAQTQQKLSKAEIRQLLQDSLAQRPRQQQSAQQQHQQSQSLVGRTMPAQQTKLPPQLNQQNGYPPQLNQQKAFPSQLNEQNGFPPQINQQKSVSHQLQPSNSSWQQQVAIVENQLQQQPPPGQIQSRGPTPTIPSVQMGSSRPTSQLQASSCGPVPCQKPPIPYSSSIAKARAPGLQTPAHPANSQHLQQDLAEVGRRTATSVARVPPNSHVVSTPTQLHPTHPGNAAASGTYMVLMPPSSLQQHQEFQRPRQHQPQQQLLGGPLRHAASSMQLSGVPITSHHRASQPDCQKLVAFLYPANPSDPSVRVYAGREKLGPLQTLEGRGEGFSASEVGPRTRASPESVDRDSSHDCSNVSVRTLASRFEGAKPYAVSDCQRQDSLRSDGRTTDSPQATVQRVRSKSESSSRKPKSVLKNKKNKGKPRKSVTFADSIAHFADVDEPNSGYESARESSSFRPRFTDSRAYYSDDEDHLGSHISYSDNELDDLEDAGSSNSDESPVPEEEQCQLCRKRKKELGKQFCDKCSFYMGKLQVAFPLSA